MRCIASARPCLASAMRYRSSSSGTGLATAPAVAVIGIGESIATMVPLPSRCRPDRASWRTYLPWWRPCLSTGLSPNAQVQLHVGRDYDALWSVVNPASEMHDSVQERGGRGRHVERPDPSANR